MHLLIVRQWPPLMLPTAAAGGTGTASTAIGSGGDIDDPIRLLRKALIRRTMVLPAFDLFAAWQVWTNCLCAALIVEEMAALDVLADGAGGAEDNASTAGAVGGVGTVDGIVFIEREAMLLYYGSTWIVQIVG